RFTTESVFVFFFSSRRRHTRSYGDWSSDVCSSDLCAAGLGHLHQTEHAFIHASAAGGRDDDDCNAFGRGKLDHAGNAFAHHRTHGGGKKSEIHHRDRDFHAFKHSVTTQDRID